MTNKETAEIIKTAIAEVEWEYPMEYAAAFDRAIEVLEQEPKTGHWIEIAKYSDGKHKIECSECGNHIFDRGHANSYNVKEKYKYCPRCGAKMVEPQESGDKE